MRFLLVVMILMYSSVAHASVGTDLLDKEIEIYRKQFVDIEQQLVEGKNLLEQIRGAVVVLEDIKKKLIEAETETEKEPEKQE